MHTHSAAGGGERDAIRSKPTKAKRPASLLIRALPMNPLLPVMMTTSGSIAPQTRKFVIASQAVDWLAGGL